jgi:hypothetical protein
LYKNFFQPTIKLVEKVRVEGKIHRKYDEPRTPFQRVMESGQISQAAQKRLQARYESLNVAALHRRIEVIGRRTTFRRSQSSSESKPSTSIRRSGETSKD